MAEKGLRSELKADLSLQDPGTLANESWLSRFASSGTETFKYDLVQSTLSGLTQIPDHFLGSKLEERTKQYDKITRNSEFGSAEWYGDVAGGTLAAAIKFGVFYRLVGPGAAAKFETSAKYGLLTETAPFIRRSATPYLAKSALAGGAINALITPTDDANHFGRDRATNFGFGALSWGMGTAASIGLKATGSELMAANASRAKFFTGKLLMNDMVAGAGSGLLVGEVETDGRSFFSTGKLASWEDRIKSVAGTALGGALGGGLNIAHENIRPTSGARGFRTIDDVSRWADESKVPGKPDPVDQRNLANKPPRADELMHMENLTYDQEILVAARRWMDKSPLHEEYKKDFIRDMQARLIMDEAIFGQPRENPMLTIWGGVGVPIRDFEYQMMRGTAGHAVHLGIDVQTGGGKRPVPEGGSIMQAGNQGAAEAGGRSRGVLLSKLVGEQGQTGNDYMTERWFHPNFATRKAHLRAADYFILAKGGLGSLDELFDKKTNIQVKKEAEAPIYIDSKYYAATLKQIKQMVEWGTAKQSDFDRLVPFRDGRDILNDIVRREAIRIREGRPLTSTGVGWGNQPLTQPPPIDRGMLGNAVQSLKQTRWWST